MKHQIVKYFVYVATILGLLLSLPGSAYAKTPTPPTTPSSPVTAKYPGCEAGASTMFGPAPLTVDFFAKSPEEGVAYNWGFGDGNGGTGKTITHTFVAEGVYKVRAFTTSVEGFYNTCPLMIITVTRNENPATTSPAPVLPAPTTPQSQGSASATGTGTTKGNNSPVININGGSNVTVKVQSAPSVQAAPASEPKPLSFWQKFWLPWKNFWRMIVSDLQGLFDLNQP